MVKTMHTSYLTPLFAPKNEIDAGPLTVDHIVDRTAEVFTNIAIASKLGYTIEDLPFPLENKNIKFTFTHIDRYYLSYYVYSNNICISYGNDIIKPENKLSTMLHAYIFDTTGPADIKKSHILQGEEFYCTAVERKNQFEFNPILKNMPSAHNRIKAIKSLQKYDIIPSSLKIQEVSL
jgi:hypothetical protein